jgi:hypothetical protein
MSLSCLVILIAVVLLVLFADPLAVFLTRCRTCKRFVFARDETALTQRVTCTCGENYTRETPVLFSSD